MLGDKVPEVPVPYPPTRICFFNHSQGSCLMFTSSKQFVLLRYLNSWVTSPRPRRWAQGWRPPPALKQILLRPWSRGSCRRAPRPGVRRAEAGKRYQLHRFGSQAILSSFLIKKRIVLHSLEKTKIYCNIFKFGTVGTVLRYGTVGAVPRRLPNYGYTSPVLKLEIHRYCTVQL